MSAADDLERVPDEDRVTEKAAETEEPSHAPRGKAANLLTDAGSSQMFLSHWGNKLRWVPDWGTWVRFDGKRWTRRSEDELVPLAVRTAREYIQYAYQTEDLEDRAAIIKHAIATQGANRLHAMIRLARGSRVARSSEFDRDHYLLNAANGVVDLRTGELGPHSRERLLTKMAPHAFDPDAQCPQWEAFLARVLPDAAVRTWVQRYLGYCCTGDVGEQVLAFFHGAGANGKSTLVEVVMRVLGDYAMPGAPDLLLAKNGESHPTEVADLEGSRLVACQETEVGRRWAEAQIKRLTGGDAIKARKMRVDFYTFAPTHKLIVSANHKPKVRGQDEGIWRRIRLVPFAVTIPPAERDRALVERLVADEASGILRWLVEGCIEWQLYRLGDVAAIDAATREYRVDQDVLAHFVSDECETGTEFFAPHDELYPAFTRWCMRTGEISWKRDTLVEGLCERGYERGKGAKGKRGIRGLRVRERFAEPAP